MSANPRFSFTLPAGWEPRPASAAPVQGVDLAALYAIADQGFTPNITVALQRVRDLAGLEQIAEQTVQLLARSHPDVTVARRAPLGGERAPGIGQEVRFTADVAGSPVTLTQVQVVLAAGPLDEAGQVVFKSAFTATERQAPSLLPAFQQFVAGLALADEEG